MTGRIKGMKNGELIGKVDNSVNGAQKENGQRHKQVYPLRFGKSGKVEIEKAYATHSVAFARIAA